MIAATAGDVHAETWNAETFVSGSDASWFAWYDAACELAGHDLDGDEPSGDAYSVDGAYVAWEQGSTPAEYVARIRA